MNRQQGSALKIFLIVLAIVAAVVVIGVKLIAPPIVKQKIEQEGSKNWGAEVNVADVSIHLFPIAATVSGIQLTNPEKPQENLATIASVYGDPDIIATLQHDMKPILERVDVHGVKLHQPRKTPGKVTKKPDQLVVKTKALATQGLPDFDHLKVPDAQAILKNEKLQTLEQAEKLKRQLADLQKQWQAIQKSLPSADVIKQYQQKLSSLQKGGLNPQALQDIQAIKADIEKQKKKLAQAKKLLAQVNDLKRQLAQLKSLPQQDLQRLQQKYSFNITGASNLVQTLIGGTLAQYLQVGAGWAQRLKAMTAQKPDQGPGPAQDVLVRLFTLDGQLPSGQLQARADNVTLNQALYRVTTGYEVDFLHKAADKPVAVKGVLDLQNPSLAQLKALLEGVGIRFSDLKLFDSPTLALAMKQAAASINGKADVISWEKIQGEVGAHFEQVSMDLLKAQSPEVQRYLKPVLQNLKAFHIKVAVSGSLTAPKIQVKTDLDKYAGKALQAVLQSEFKAVQAQLKDALMKRALGENQQLMQQLQPLLGAQGQVADLDKQLDSLLKTQLKQKLPGGVNLPGGIKLPF